MISFTQKKINAIKRKIMLLDLISKKSMSSAQILVHYEKKSELSFDLTYLKERKFIKALPRKFCNVSKVAAIFYIKTNKEFNGQEQIKAAMKSELNKLKKQEEKNIKLTAKAILDLQESQTVIKDKVNPNLTTYINSKKPSGWYSYQRVRSDKVNRGIASSFYVV